ACCLRTPAPPGGAAFNQGKEPRRAEGPRLRVDLDDRGRVLARLRVHLRADDGGHPVVLALFRRTETRMGWPVGNLGREAARPRLRGGEPRDGAVRDLRGLLRDHAELAAQAAGRLLRSPDRWVSMTDVLIGGMR